MTFNYDLVILGASPEGIYAAQEAIKFVDKRIALVIQGFSPREMIAKRDFGLAPPSFQQTFLPFSPSEVTAQTTIAEEILAVLAAQGVDVIESKGIFIQAPALVVQVDNRYLRSRAYLLAMGTEPDFSEMTKFFPNFSPKTLWTEQSLRNSRDWQQGDTWAIIGATPFALDFVHYLASLGKKVTLITRNAHILPQEDRESAHFLQASLEAMAIKILLKTEIQRIQLQGSQFQINIWNQFLEKNSQLDQIDHIFWAQKNKTKLGGLNLADIGVQLRKNRILVNRQLQTSLPKLYAIGTAIGGYDLPSLAEYEARLVLQNTLTAQPSPVNYFPIPVCLTHQPTFARVGLTEVQARECYGEQIRVLRSYFSPVSDIQPEGFCKLILNSQEEIIGTHLIGDRAEAWINVFALAIAQKLALKNLQNLNLAWLRTEKR